MEKINVIEVDVNKVVIEKARNGYQVYLREWNYNSQSTPIPYVFETMEGLLDFVKEQFENN